MNSLNPLSVFLIWSEKCLRNKLDLQLCSAWIKLFLNLSCSWSLYISGLGLSPGLGLVHCLGLCPGLGQGPSLSRLLFKSVMTLI